jgi:hypothetical protein
LHAWAKNSDLKIIQPVGNHDDLHAGSDRRFNSIRRVFKSETVFRFWNWRKSLTTDFESIWRRLPIFDIWVASTFHDVEKVGEELCVICRF